MGGRMGKNELVQKEVEPRLPLVQQRLRPVTASPLMSGSVTSGPRSGPAGGGIDTGYTDLARASTGGGISDLAVPVPTPALVDQPVLGDTKPGFIDSDDGANIRNRPAELNGSEKLTSTPLPPTTRVIVGGTHRDTDQWLYVTALLPGGGLIRGYIQKFRIAIDLPEPTARLYEVEPGDTAERLAVRMYASAIRDGHDLRYYENVLLHVNRSHGRAGVRGSYQNPGIFGGGAENVQLEAGRRIWLVSPAYAKALESLVPSGSLTGGAYAKVERFMGHLKDIWKSVTRSPAYLDEVAGEYAQAIRDHAAEIIGLVVTILAAEVFSGLLAATPTGVTQIIAVVIQLGLAAFGAAGLVSAGVEALRHARQWLTLAWTAKGDDATIAAASREFIRMLVQIAMAALAYLGAKGNLGKASTLLKNGPPPMMPALATVGGPPIHGGTTAVVRLGPPEPFVFGPAFAMAVKPTSEGAPASSSAPTLQARARGLPTRASQLRRTAEELPSDAPDKSKLVEAARKLEEESALLKDLGGASLDDASALKAEIEGLEARLKQLEAVVDKKKPVTSGASMVPRPHLKHPGNYLPTSGTHPYRPPKRPGNPEFVRHPEGNGFLDDLGNRWEFAKDPHAGPHWDVQHPNGKHTNVYPDGIVHQGADKF